MVVVTNMAVREVEQRALTLRYDEFLMDSLEDVHLAVVDGRELHPNPIPSAQRLMHEKAADARHLAWDLLRNSLEDGAPSG